MASRGYTYTSDLDGDLVGTVMPPQEEGSPHFMDGELYNRDESQSMYEYLDNSLAESHANESDEAPAALALEDYMGFGSSNIPSLLSGSTSAFDIGNEEASAQTQTSSAASQSVSGTDFDALAMIPVAGQTTAESRAAVPSGRHSVRHQFFRINIASDVKQLSAPSLDKGGGSSTSAAGHNSTVKLNASPTVGGNHHRSAKDTSNHRGASSNASTDHKSTTSALPLGKAANMATTLPFIEPTPPPLHPVSTISHLRNDSEGFSFGIDAFLHGNKLGFGRQPSFKRLAPAAQSESKRYSLGSRLSNGDASPILFAEVNRQPAAGTSSTRARVSLVGDQNEEAFNTWLEDLEPKAQSLSSARSGLNPTQSDLTVGGKLKRAVDSLMKNLLGGYDLFATGVIALPGDPSSVSGVPLPLGSTTRPKDLQGSGWSGACARPAVFGDSQPAEFEDFLGWTRTPISTLRLPASEGVQIKQQAGQPSVPSFRGSVLRQMKPEMTYGNLLSRRDERRGSGGGCVGVSTTALSSSPSQPQSNAPSRQRHLGSTPIESQKMSLSTAVAGNGESFSVSTAATCTETDLAITLTRLKDGVGNVVRLRSQASLGNAPPCPYMDEDLLEGGYITGPPQFIRSPLGSTPNNLGTGALGSEATFTSRDSGAHRNITTVDIPSSPARSRRFSLISKDFVITKQRALSQQQKLHPSWCNLQQNTSDTRGITASSVAGKAASGEQQKALAATTPSDSSKPLMRACGYPCGRLSSSSPSDSATSASSKAKASPHSYGDRTMGRKDEIPVVSLTAAFDEGGLAYRDGKRTDELPLLITSGNDNSNTQQGMFSPKSGSVLDSTGSPLNHIRKVDGIEMPNDFTGRPVGTPVELETVALKMCPPVLRRSSSLSRRGSTSRTDLAPTTSGQYGTAATPPRRRLTEYRNGDYMLQHFSRSRISASTLEDPHPEEVKQQDLDRQMQQSNEERRQRIQAFLARRRAEKRLEEQRRAEMLSRERQADEHLGGQDQQDILEAAPRLQIPITVGSGLNAIKASKRIRKSLPKRNRAIRQSIPVAGLIPEAAMVAATAVPETAPPPQRGKACIAAVKNKVRAVVVLMGSVGTEEKNLSAALNNHEGKKRCSRGSTAPSTAASGSLKDSTVVLRLGEKRNTLSVQVSPEHTRFYAVDELLQVNETLTSRYVDESLRESTGASTQMMSNSVLPRQRLSSLTLTEMNRRFLAGVNVALLLASSPRAHHGSLAAIQEVVSGVLSHMPPQGELLASIAFVSDGKTVDLLSDTMHMVSSSYSSSPLFGPTLESVSYVPVAGLSRMTAMVSKAYKLCNLAKQQQHRSGGVLVMSLILKQQRGSDVVLSSYLITDAGNEGGTYMSILRKVQSTPFPLFRSALGGSTLTTALVSLSVADPETVVPLLDVQYRLANVTNKPCYVGSVQRFLELAQQELQNNTEDEAPGKTRYPGTNTTVASEVQRDSPSISSNSSEHDSVSYLTSPSGLRGHRRHSGKRTLLHKRLVESVVMAQSILDDPAGCHPTGIGEASRYRRASVLTVAAHSSAPAALPLSLVTTPSDPRYSVDDATRKEADVVAPRRSSVIIKAGDSSLPLPAFKARLPSQGAGVTPPHSGSFLSSAVDKTASHSTQYPATRRPSGAFGADLDLNFRKETPSAQLAASNKGHEGNESVRPRLGQQQRFVAAVGRQSISNSVNTDYVRRGSDNGAGQHTTRFMNFEDVEESSSTSVASKRHAATLGSKGEQEKSQHLSKSPVAVMSADPIPGSHNAVASEPSRRDKVMSSGGVDGSTQELLVLPLEKASRDASASKAELQAASEKIIASVPQRPSVVFVDLTKNPTVSDVEPIDSSLVHDSSLSVKQNSTLDRAEKAPVPISTKVRTLVLVDSSCRETSNVTYDNTMVIATTEDDFEEYEVDEVLEVMPGRDKLLQSNLLMELCDTLLRGCNAAILSADSRPTGFSVQALKSVVHMTFEKMNRGGDSRSGQLSASVVKVKGESVVDLLKDSGKAEKLVIAISPLFGSCVHGVTYSNITSSTSFNDTMDAALHRDASDDNGRDHGFIFCSLLFKLQLEDERDVLVCSLVATLASEHFGLYTSVLDRSPLVPRALFHYALGGPSFTVALLGISGKEYRANQMLQVQRRLGEMSNRATHPGSVAKFISGIRNDLTPNLIAKYENSRDQSERAETKELMERLAEMVKDADALLHDFDHHQPKAYLHEGKELGAASESVASVQGPASGSPPTKASGGFDVSTHQVFKLPMSTSAVGAVGETGQRALPSITAVDPESADHYIQSLVCYEEVLMGAGSVAVEGNSILCTSQGGMRYDSDEVIVCNATHRFLSSKLIDQLVEKLLGGYHTGLLSSDSSYSAFTPLMLRRIVGGILGALSSGWGELREGSAAVTGLSKSPMVAGELHVSIALIKDDVTADLLPINVDETYHRFEMDHRPLYGSRVVGVTSHLVSMPHDFDNLLAVAIDNADPALQSADPGIMVVSLVLTQRVGNPAEDVLVSSLLCTAVFDAVHHYERVLERNPSEPLELFRNILRGPCFSVALFGISDEEENPGKLLRALHGITQVRNRPPQVNSVSRYIQELQRGIVELKERMTTSSNEGEKEYIVSRVKVAERLLADAEALKRNPFSTTNSHAFVPLDGSPGLSG